MKKIFVKTIGVFILVTGLLNMTYAQRFCVRVRPAVPVVVKPVTPAASYVRIDGDWYWQNNGYRWREGYWSAPPRPHAVWVAGRWMRERRGCYWAPGYWR